MHIPTCLRLPLAKDNSQPSVKLRICAVLARSMLTFHLISPLFPLPILDPTRETPRQRSRTQPRGLRPRILYITHPPLKKNTKHHQAFAEQAVCNSSFVLDISSFRPELKLSQALAKQIGLGVRSSQAF